MTRFAPPSRRAALGLIAAAAAYPLPALAEGFELDPIWWPTRVATRENYAPGQLLVSTAERFLYWVDGPGTAIRYGIGVGQAGLEFTGSAVIGAKKEWPSWTPTQEMIERDPAAYEKYADGMPGGPGNPLGARALYLFKGGADTFFRIHGTNRPQSIGTDASNGCIRMANAHVIDLYERVPIGTPVFVV